VSVESDYLRIERRIDAIAGEPRRPALRIEGERFARFVVPGSVARAIADGAERAGIDPALVAAVAQTESGGDPNARSAAGAQGVMQLMPETARSLGVADPYDPAQNVRAGAHYLRTLIDRFGDLKSAIAAYNAGPGAVAHYGGVPPYRETQRYVERVMEAYRSNLHR
jgi:soluble lytic murein transglycosylase-like protein